MCKVLKVENFLRQDYFAKEKYICNQAEWHQLLLSCENNKIRNCHKTSKSKQLKRFNFFPVWLQNRLISAGLELVPRHTE